MDLNQTLSSSYVRNASLSKRPRPIEGDSMDIDSSSETLLESTTAMNVESNDESTATKAPLSSDNADANKSTRKSIESTNNKKKVKRRAVESDSVTDITLVRNDTAVINSERMRLI